MFKQMRLLWTLLAGLTLMSGCSQSDGQSASTTQEVLVIDGYTLPPDPGEAGKTTVLGIDSNDNGVRDDVEIWIYKKYQGQHPIVKEIAMQTGRAFQVILEHPENAKETYHVLNAAQFCGLYFLYDAIDNGEPQLINERIQGDEFKEIQLNTKARVKAYMEYDHLLSGGIYDLPSDLRQYCDFNITKILAVEE